MKKLNFLFFIIFVLSVNSIKAAETEPNNSKADANTLTLNGSNSGTINVSGDEDWWKVTTNADGKLDVTISVSNGKTLRCYIYDNNGTKVLSSSYSSGTNTVSEDGLAAGVYYIKLIAYTNGQLPAYTVSNTLTNPAEANDAEPNDNRAQAKVLPLNGNKTGHVGYYYNLERDTADWYKITTNADGLLRVTLEPGNGTTTRIYLYDNDGTTLLNSSYSSTNAVINEDGLATGTYYVKVICYNTAQFAPYTISDSLFEPAEAKDIEPNDSRAQAKVLPLNDNETGHVGYYNNVERDTADWYKITTNADGLLRVALQPANGTTTRIYLYDNDGTTLLNSSYSSTNAVINEDGLATGTYYVKVICYNTSQFAAYTISDSLFTYSYTNDEEPNGNAFQAKTILSNENTDGHVGFYYNNTRDTVDWYKINYTGSGNLGFTINQETLKSGGTNTMYFQVYKDTTKSPIHSSYSSAASRPVNLTALAQGYYWIKIYTYSHSDFSSYSFSNSFTQINTAKVTVSDYDSPGSCSSTNNITFNCINGQSPYSLQLYRFGVPYGEPVTTNRKAVFKNLPEGLYYADGYSDGATGTAFAKSKAIKLIPTPAGLNTTNILAVRTTINWTTVPCAAFYSINYSEHNSGVWTTRSTDGNVNNYVLKGLSPNTMYDWTVASVDTANNKKMIGLYPDSISFTTATSSLIADNDNGADNLSINSGKGFGSEITIAPNPATSYFAIHYNTSVKSNLTASLYDVNGKPVWTSGSINSDALNGKKVIVNQFGSGLYYLKIVDDKGAMLDVAKVSITK